MESRAIRLQLQCSDADHHRHPLQWLLHCQNEKERHVRLMPPPEGGTTNGAADYRLQTTD